MRVKFFMDVVLPFGDGIVRKGWTAEKYTNRHTGISYITIDKRYEKFLRLYLLFGKKYFMKIVPIYDESFFSGTYKRYIKED